MPANSYLFLYVFHSLPGHESPSGSRCVISEFIRPLQISGDKPEQLSVKPTFLSKSRSGTPRCRFDSDVSLYEFGADNVCHGAKTSPGLRCRWIHLPLETPDMSVLIF